MRIAAYFNFDEARYRGLIKTNSHLLFDELIRKTRQKISQAGELPQTVELYQGDMLNILRAIRN